MGANQSVAAVAVTFNPEADRFRRLLEALVPQVDALIVVDNASTDAAEVRALAEEFGTHLIFNATNEGIAAAQNRGIAWALGHGFDHVLLSDQDSLPAPDMVAELLAALREATVPVAAVGPIPVNEEDGEVLLSGFAFWRPTRTTPPAPGEVLEVPTLIASGMLIPRAALLAVGPMNSSLFIDGVDTAWCLRAIHEGWTILAVGSAHLTHSLGGRSVKTMARERAIHLQSPTRNYYITRNALLMSRAEFVPLPWKIGNALWLAQMVGYYALAAPDAREQRPALWQGVVDGLRGVVGPRPS